jgi:hypothetical protein
MARASDRVGLCRRRSGSGFLPRHAVVIRSLATNRGRVERQIYRLPVGHARLRPVVKAAGPPGRLWSSSRCAQCVGPALGDSPSSRGRSRFRGRGITSCTPGVRRRLCVTHAGRCRRHPTKRVTVLQVCAGQSRSARPTPGIRSPRDRSRLYQQCKQWRAARRKS